MVVVNERNWNSMQSGLRRVKQDIDNERYSSTGNVTSKYVPLRAERSPRLPRLNSAESDMRKSPDLRRAKFNVVPPVHRSFSLESMSNDQERNKDKGVFTPPSYFNSNEEKRKAMRRNAVPNKSISNFLSKMRESKKESPVGSSEVGFDVDEESLQYERVAPHSFRKPPVKRAFNYLEEDLAPTPVSEAERTRHVHLRRRGDDKASLNDVRKRGSLEEFVDKLREERRQSRQMKTTPSSPSLSYKPLNGFHHYPERDHYPVSNKTSSGADAIVESVAESLIHDLLEEDLIPDLLIEVFIEAKNSAEIELHSRRPFPDDHSSDLLASLDKLHKSLPKPKTFEDEALKPPTHHYPWIKSNPGIGGTPVDPSILSQDNLLFRRTLDPILREPLVRSIQFDTVELLVGQVIDEMLPDIAREAIFDVVLEDYIETDLVGEVVREESSQVVLDTLKRMDARVETKQRRAVDSFAREKLMDSFSLDHTLDLIARSGRIYTDDQRKDKIIDDMVLDILLSQFVNVRNRLDSTARNVPLRRLHERLVSDVATEVVLEELQLQLDEDLEDLHEYETGLDDPKLLEKSLMLAAASEELPEGLKDWIKSVDAAFAPAKQQQPPNFSANILTAPPSHPGTSY